MLSLRDPPTPLYDEKRERKQYDVETLIMSHEMPPREVDYRGMRNG
jgi:hypothetical protein